MAADDTYSASELRNRNLGATNDSLSATQLRAKHGIVGGTCTGKDLAGNSGGQASLARLAEKIEELEKKEKIQREATESVVHALAFMQEWLGRNSLWSNEVAVTEKGIEEAEEPEKLERAASVPSSLTPGSSSNGSSSSSAKPDMSQAFDAMSKNPEMIEQATEMMSKMSDEDIARMMPGTNPAMVRQSMQNKDQLKTAMESFKNMPEDQRKKLMEQSANMQAGGVPDMSKMSEMFENPEMMKQVAEMAKNQEGVDPEQAEMMRTVTEQLQNNPELGKQMSDMMKNMPPEQMQKMMEMSAKMKGGMGKNGQAMDPSSMDMDSMSSFMDDPSMMKAAEDMMKNMSPEMLASMAKSSGVDLDENKAAMLGKVMPYLPYLMRCMRAFGYLRKGWKALWTAKGRVCLAVVVLCFALYQHNFSQ